MARKKNLKRKLEIVFDAQKRREFLTGFSKRKNARRKCAKEELEKRIKEERKRIRQEIKNGVQHLKKSFEPLRELTDEDKIPMEENVTNEEEYEDDDVKIKIVELTTKEMAKRTHCLGENYPSDNDNDDGNDVSNEYNSTKKRLEKKSIKDLNSIPGMDYDNEQKIKLANDEPKNSIVMNHTSTKNSNAKLMININRSEIKSKKDLNHLMKMNTMKQMRKSKVFQMKKRLEQNANQKRARRKQRNTMKSLPKHLRNLKKLPINRYHKERLKTKNRKKRK